MTTKTIYSLSSTFSCKGNNYRIEPVFDGQQTSVTRYYENRLGRKSYLSKTQFSSYEVADGGDHFTMFSPNRRLRFASADEAKAAAQADFEARVKECLI